MKVDLSRYGFDAFYLFVRLGSADVSLGDIIALAPQGLLEREDEEMGIAVGAYTRARQVYLVSLGISQPNDEFPMLTIMYNPLSAGDSIHSTRRLRRNIDGMQMLLRSLTVACTITAHAHCRLADGWRTVVTLPMLTMSGGVFDEIRGVRVVKTVDGEEAESAVLDSAEPPPAGCDGTGSGPVCASGLPTTGAPPFSPVPSGRMGFAGYAAVLDSGACPALMLSALVLRSASTGCHHFRSSSRIARTIPVSLTTIQGLAPLS